MTPKTVRSFKKGAERYRLKEHDDFSIQFGGYGVSQEDGYVVTGTVEIGGRVYDLRFDVAQAKKLLADLANGIDGAEKHQEDLLKRKDRD